MSKTPERNIQAPKGAILSKFLRALAVEVETVDDSGDPVIKAAALAKLVWQYALGFEKSDPDKPDKKITIPPDWRAIELLYNRIEGKIPLAVVEDQGRSLADKVSDLGKAKINSMAKAAADEPEDEEFTDEDA
jgi:hypothetical protein